MGTVIMSNGVLQPGMVMPTLPPPPPEPHPDRTVQRMRDAWNMNIIGWDAIFPHVRMPHMREGHAIGGAKQAGPVSRDLAEAAPAAGGNGAEEIRVSGQALAQL
jgi:hypothetical protein